MGGPLGAGLGWAMHAGLPPGFSCFLGESHCRLLVVRSPHPMAGWLPRPPRPPTGKTFQCNLAFKKLGIAPIVMSAGELESGNAGEPAKLIRQRYREASDIIKKGKVGGLDLRGSGSLWWEPHSGELAAFGWYCGGAACCWHSWSP